MKPLKNIFKNVKWHDFKTDSPNDYRTDSRFEDDPDYCWVLYDYIPKHNDFGPFLTHKPTAFVDGYFVDLKKNFDSPYEVDHIEILYWCNNNEVMRELAKSKLGKVKW